MKVLEQPKKIGASFLQNLDFLLKASEYRPMARSELLHLNMISFISVRSSSEIFPKLVVT